MPPPTSCAHDELVVMFAAVVVAVELSLSDGTSKLPPHSFTSSPAFITVVFDCWFDGFPAAPHCDLKGFSPAKQNDFSCIRNSVIIAILSVFG